jgi:NAD(P)-dependent dehydrogenase (short-subunit alcohol dehydrogenase family)
MSSSPISKTICITGCTRGLGRALVETFTREGWRIIGCGRTESTIRQLQQQYPDGYFAVADTSNADAVEMFAKAAVAAVGPPDLLLNNAAIINANAPLWKVPSADFAKVTAVNINGVFHIIRSFLPSMIAAGRGIVVNFSSGWGRSTSPEVAPYCATKWAIEGLSQALAQELPAGMACVSLNPGVIDTEMLRSCFGAAAGDHPDADRWAAIATPFLLKLRTGDNGRALSVS